MKQQYPQLESRQEQWLDMESRQDQCPQPLQLCLVGAMNYLVLLETMLLLYSLSFPAKKTDL
jgi:hypothetical protein